jgi:membrane-associated phospholipid phosphatase
VTTNPPPLPAPPGPNPPATAPGAGRRTAGPAGRRRRLQRHPTDLLRVLAGSVVVAAGGMAAHHHHLSAFQAKLFRLVNQLPDTVGGPLLAVMQLGALAAVPTLAALALATRRPRLAADLALSGTLAWLLAKLVKGLVGEARPVALLPGVVVRGVDPGLGYPSGHVAVAAALATAAGPWLPHRARRAAWGVVWLVALGRIYAGAHLPLDVVGGAALGWAVAAAVHLASGTPASPPTTSTTRQGRRGRRQPTPADPRRRRAARLPGRPRRLPWQAHGLPGLLHLPVCTEASRSAAQTGSRRQDFTGTNRTLWSPAQGAL